MRKKIVGFLARAHGLDVLEELARDGQFEICKIFTHSLNPRSQDPERKIRGDYHRFVEICNRYKIPLQAVDSRYDDVVVPECDYIIEVSWRYVIPVQVTQKASNTAFGIHRGRLPEYAGAEPIRQALENDDREIIISAHYLDSEIDAGKVINFVSHEVNYNSETTRDENIQRLREEITPYFAKLVLDTIKKLQTKT